MRSGAFLLLLEYSIGLGTFLSHGTEQAQGTWGSVSMYSDGSFRSSFVPTLGGGVWV